MLALRVGEASKPSLSLVKKNLGQESIETLEAQSMLSLH